MQSLIKKIKLFQFLQKIQSAFQFLHDENCKILYAIKRNDSILNFNTRWHMALYVP